MPTPTTLHDHTPTPGSLDFFDHPRAQGKGHGRRIRDPDYANSLMPSREMPTAEYYGTGHVEFDRQQNRRVRVPPRGVDLNVQYLIKEKIVVVTAQADERRSHEILRKDTRASRTLYGTHYAISFMNKEMVPSPALCAKDPVETA